MAYRITFEPLNPIAGVKPTTVEIKSAVKAWDEVGRLMRSDERVTIVNPHGDEIGWQELKKLADKEHE